MKLLLPSPLEKLNDPLFNKSGIQVFAKRDDLIDAEISGNKWRKLKYNIEAAKGLPILTFGGAFSNHIAATAAACNRLGIKSIGIIRGERTAILNNTLQQAEDYGMHLYFVSRSEYRLKNSPEFRAALVNKFGPFYLIPEGGANLLGVKGAGEIITETEQPFDYLVSVMGTGTTLAGMQIASKKHQQQIGIPVLKNGGFLKEETDTLINEYCSYFDQSIPDYDFKMFTDYAHGGYARISDELIEFMRYFYQQHQIKTDPVYSGKSAFALYDLAKKGYFKKGTTVIWLHCGGLQGIEGIENRYGIKVFSEPD
jgi:1-aminocyclopropane-1-carboxylate deaminase/D-cysteine desulfhydrase-like pyridoxal-dependent ACC family enzyme